MVKNMPAMQETWVRSLDWEDPLEKGTETHSSILLGESHGQRSLADCTPYSWKEWDTTEIQIALFAFPRGSVGKESACNVGELGSIPGLGRSPGEGNGNPLQYSYLENFMDRGPWRATILGVSELDVTE